MQPKKLLMEERKSNTDFIMPVAISSTAGMILLSFGRLMVASNTAALDPASLQERIGTSFDRLLSACFKVSVCSAMILEKIIDWDCDNPPWAVFQYDYLDMELPNCLSQHLLDNITHEDWYDLAENNYWPAMEMAPTQMLHDYVMAWAKARKLPLCGLDTPTAFVLRTAQYCGVQVEVRKHYIGQFATVYVMAPESLSKADQRALLETFRQQLVNCPGGALRSVMTHFDNPPRFNRHTGKIDLGHPRHGDPLIEIDSFIWEGE